MDNKGNNEYRNEEIPIRKFLNTVSKKINSSNYTWLFTKMNSVHFKDTQKIGTNVFTLIFVIKILHFT